MALPLCLDRLVNVAVALVLSTTAIVLFGECAAAVLLWGARAAATAGLCSCSRACDGAGEVNDGCSGVGGQQGRRHVSGVGSSYQHRWSGRAHIISTHLSPGTIACVLPRAFHLRPGEILPQAVCSRYGLSIGGHAAPVVRLLMWLTAPISWPIGKGLDWMLGKEQPVFGKRQISALVDLHRCACVSSLAAGDLQLIQPGKPRLHMGPSASVWAASGAAQGGRPLVNRPHARLYQGLPAVAGRPGGAGAVGAGRGGTAGPTVCYAQEQQLGGQASRSALKHAVPACAAVLPADVCAGSLQAWVVP